MDEAAESADVDFLRIIRFEIIQRGLQLLVVRVDFLLFQSETADERGLYLQQACAGAQLAGHGGRNAQLVQLRDAADDFFVAVFAGAYHIVLLCAAPRQRGRIHREVADVRQRRLVDDAADGCVLCEPGHLVHSGGRHEDDVSLCAFAVHACGKQTDAPAGHFDELGRGVMVDFDQRSLTGLGGKVQGKARV